VVIRSIQQQDQAPSGRGRGDDQTQLRQQVEAGSVFTGADTSLSPSDPPGAPNRAGPDGPYPNGLTITGAAGNTEAGIQQRIESFNSYDLAGPERDQERDLGDRDAAAGVVLSLADGTLRKISRWETDKGACIRGPF